MFSCPRLKNVTNCNVFLSPAKKCNKLQFSFFDEVENRFLLVLNPSFAYAIFVLKCCLLKCSGTHGTYRAGKPFFYGLAIGYVTGVTLSVAVDLVWFPAQRHHTHGW